MTEVGRNLEEHLGDQDIVLDTIGGETQNRSWQVLRKGGILINLNAPFSSSNLAGRC